MGNLSLLPVKISYFLRPCFALYPEKRSNNPGCRTNLSFWSVPASVNIAEPHYESSVKIRVCRNAYESRTQANMMNNRGSFMVIPFAMIWNIRPWYDEGGDSACPHRPPLRLAMMKHYLFGGYRIWGEPQQREWNSLERLAHSWAYLQNRKLRGATRPGEEILWMFWR